MDFRRSGQLDERRRRVLRDELAQPADSDAAESSPAGGGSAKGPVRAYSPAVLAERQLLVSDFVPARPLWAAVVILLALTAVAAVQCIHIHAQTLELGSAAAIAVPRLAAFDLSRPGSLGSWLAALLLAGGALLALVVFGIRAHRVDDYRGSYRVWLWAAAALAWASLDSATAVHDALGLALAMLAGQSPASPTFAAACTLSWLAVYALVFGTLAIRLAMEVWCSLPAVAALALAGLFYVLAALGVLDMLPPASPLVASVVESMLVLLAHVAVFSTVTLYARHVYLDATGRLKVHIDPDKKRGIKKSRARLKVVKDDKADAADDSPAATAAAAKSANSPPLRFGMSSTTNQQPKAGAAIAKSAASSDDYEDESDDDDDDESYSGQRLSRAERRRLKKLARRRAA